MLRTATALALAAGCGLSLSACGFLASGDRPATKPEAFVLRGYVSVRAAPADSATGSPCEAPPGSGDIHTGGTVRIADRDGHTLATGELTGGVLAFTSGTARCNFPFEIPAVPGGVDEYVVGVGSRPTVTFAARALRENRPAVVTVDP